MFIFPLAKKVILSCDIINEMIEGGKIK